MGRAPFEISEFLQAIEGSGRDLSLALSLSDEELAALEEGIARLGDPVEAACRVILGDWSRLDDKARVAALLVLANALAAQCEIRR